jgi:starch synthase
MKILFVGAEAAPIAKVGGMGDVIGALPKYLRKLGHDVRIIIPYYGFLPDKMEIPSEPIWQGSAMSQNFSVFETVLPDSDVPLYLLGHHVFAPRHIYGGDNEYWRFTFFSNGAAEFAWNYWKPEVIHCHDWHTGMIPVWMHQSPDINTVFTIHNLAYQGPGRGLLEKITWCPHYMQGDNTMAAGIQFANKVTTVSPTYTEQIKTPEYGEKLNSLLSWQSEKLEGIINGIDQDIFNPATDKFIPKTFTCDTLENRKFNKISLQEEAGLEIQKDAFLVGMVTRLVGQKGIDLVLQVLERFLTYSNSQLIVLGTGDRHFESQLWEASHRFRGKMSVQLLYNEALSRRVYAGCDAFLMPSKFEPCGISQMLAMRYGCVPIVRNTGGLVDTVSFHDPVNNTGTGYCFDRYEALDLYTCLIRSWEGFRHQYQWQELQKRGMQQDFGWHKSAEKYVKIYQEIAPINQEFYSETRE